ncbi:hypothetical protein HWV62_36366 [Athelia sp. TMB]|nr:hypothetical protein HWV62_36366 [Athelia sp. TMB]
MALRPRTSVNRRRSRSSSIPSTRAVPISTLNDADVQHGSERAHPMSAISQRNWEDVETWRRGHQVRVLNFCYILEVPLNDLHAQSVCDHGATVSSTSGPNTWSNPLSPPSTPFFASTSSEFNLFPSRPPTGFTRRPRGQSQSLAPIDGMNPVELSRMRSDAFWELRRSVEESGEGLVRRMRDYESSRSRTAAYSKAKDSLRRGRKRQALRPRRVVHGGEGTDEDDEEVQIYAGEDSLHPRKKRALSLGMMDACIVPSGPFMDLDGGERCSSSVFSGPSVFASDNEDLDDDSMDLAGDSPLSLSLAALTSSSGPGLASSFSPSSDSSALSFSSHEFGPMSPTSPHIVPTSTRSEKAIAALSLAIANGAGGLSDYAALRAMEPIPLIEDSEVGELWH